MPPRSKLYGLEDVVKQLYISGFTCAEIVDIIKNKYNISTSDEAVRQVLIKLGVKRRRRGARVKYPQHFGVMTPLKAYIIGVLVGDGCIECRYKKGRKSKVYQIWLKTVDYSFAYAFKRICEKLYNKKLSIKVKYYKTNFTEKPRRFFKVVVTGKAIVMDLLSFVNDISMYKCFTWKVPEAIINGCKNVKIMFLRGFADSEGTVIVDRSNHRVGIRLDSKNIHGLNDVSQLLLSLGLNNKIRRVNKNEVYGCYIWSKRDVIKFAMAIGFYNMKKRKKLYNTLEQFYGVKIAPPPFPR